MTPQPYSKARAFALQTGTQAPCSWLHAELFASLCRQAHAQIPPQAPKVRRHFSHTLVQTSCSSLAAMASAPQPLCPATCDCRRCLKATNALLMASVQTLSQRVQLLEANAAAHSVVSWQPVQELRARSTHLERRVQQLEQWSQHSVQTTTQSNASRGPPQTQTVTLLPYQAARLARRVGPGGAPFTAYIQSPWRTTELSPWVYRQ